MRVRRRDEGRPAARSWPSHRWIQVAAVVAVLGGSVAFAAAAPPYASADEAAHVDYAAQVWQGRLPVFEDGLRLRIEDGALPPVQFTAQHPPAFYALLAPVVGPLVDAGKPVEAALAGRAVTTLLAILAVLAVGWAARWVVGRPGVLAASAAAVAAADVWVLRLGGAVYNDILLVLVAALLLGTAARIVRLGGATGPWWVAWLTLPALAALTRASGVPLAGLALAAVGVGACRSPHAVRALARLVVLPLVVAVAAAGWFYARNARLTGSWTGAQPEWAAENLQRRPAPVLDVLTDADFWRGSFRQLGLAPGTGSLTNALLLVVPLVVAAVVFARSPRVRRPSGPDLVVAAVIAAAVGGITLLQALYVANGGGINGRYFVVLVLPLGLVVALGLTRGRFAWVVVLTWAVVRSADLVLDVRALLDRYAGTSLAATPTAVAWVGVALFLAGMAGWVATVGWARRAPRGGTDREPVEASAPAGTR